MDLMQAVAKQTEPMLRCLSENLKIRSVQEAAQEGAPYGIGVRRCLNHALASAASLGFETVDMDHHVGWCEFGQGDELVVVLGHLDVVPEGEGWSFAPYGGEIRDGRVFGRGAMDDKGPTIAALYALAAVRDAGIPLKRRIRLIFGCNEETGSKDMVYYNEHGGEVPAMGFTPDAEYPVINGEKGIVNDTYSVKFSQDGPLKLIRIQGGSAPNVVPAYAEAELACSQALAQQLSALMIPKVTLTVTAGGLKVGAEGINAHGSTPELGENAIGRLLIALDLLPLSGDVKNAVHFLASTIGMETDGASAGIGLEDAVSGKLTLNLGTISGDENGMSMKINYRYPVTCSLDDCGPRFQAGFETAGFTLDSRVHKAGIYTPEDSELVQSLLRVYEKKTGIKGKPKSIGGGTYAKSLPNIVAFGPVFPGDEVREHQPDEFMEVDKLIKTMEIIAEAMVALAGSEGK